MSKFMSANALAFVLWALERRTAPTAADIKHRFGVHRATAYRWAAQWQDIGEPIRLRRAGQRQRTPVAPSDAEARA